MTEQGAAEVLENIRSAAGDLNHLVSPLTDGQLREPSVLPDWTRAHLLSHVEGISRAMTRQAEYAVRGERIELYDGGYEGRTAAIEAGARRNRDDVLSAVEEATRRAIEQFAALDDEDWNLPISFRDGVVLSGAYALWRELEIHGSDLGLAKTSSDWSDGFCLHLFDFLQPRVPASRRFILRPLREPSGPADSLPETITMKQGAESVEISGRLQDIAAWLAGRTPIDAVTASVGSDAVALPDLLPWPSAVRPA